MKEDHIILNIEASDKYCAFFALYAGLRMYKEQRNERDKRLKNAGVSIAAAEAFCMLEQLKELHPNEYAEAEAEFNEVYAKT